MKEITLKFREVAVDGLPKESCNVAVFAKSGITIASITDVRYSDKHKAFNCGDETDSVEAYKRRKLWSNVKYWVKMEELIAALKEDAQHVQTLD